MIMQNKAENNQPSVVVLLVVTFGSSPAKIMYTSHTIEQNIMQTISVISVR